MNTQSSDPEIYLVIPSYNESRVLAETIQALRGRNYHIVLVDDGSDEGDWAKIKNISDVHVLRHALNLGQGAAIQTGVSYALMQGADYIVHHDADGQHDPKDIKNLLAPLIADEADIVLGSRFLRAADWQVVPFGRKVLLKGGVIVNGLLTGLWLTDAHNGARALNRLAATKIVLSENGFAHATEILQQIKSHKLRYIERPTRIRYTEYSRYKGQKASNAINIFIDLIMRRFFE